MAASSSAKLGDGVGLDTKVFDTVEAEFAEVR